MQRSAFASSASPPASFEEDEDYFTDYPKAVTAAELRALGLQRIFIDGDGNCVPRCVSYRLYRTPDKFAAVRQALVDFVNRQPAGGHIETMIVKFYADNKNGERGVVVSIAAYAKLVGTNKFHMDHIDLEILACHMYKQEIGHVSVYAVENSGKLHPQPMVIGEIGDGPGMEVLYLGLGQRAQHYDLAVDEHDVVDEQDASSSALVSDTTATAGRRHKSGSNKFGLLDEDSDSESDSDGSSSDSNSSASESSSSESSSSESSSSSASESSSSESSSESSSSAAPSKKKKKAPPAEKKSSSSESSESSNKKKTVPASESSSSESSSSSSSESSSSESSSSESSSSESSSSAPPSKKKKEGETPKGRPKKLGQVPSSDGGPVLVPHSVPHSVQELTALSLRISRHLSTSTKLDGNAVKATTEQKKKNTEAAKAELSDFGLTHGNFGIVYHNKRLRCSGCPEGRMCTAPKEHFVGTARATNGNHYNYFCKSCACPFGCGISEVDGLVGSSVWHHNHPLAVGPSTAAVAGSRSVATIPNIVKQYLDEMSKLPYPMTDQNLWRNVRAEFWGKFTTEYDGAPMMSFSYEAMVAYNKRNVAQLQSKIFLSHDLVGYLQSKVQADPHYFFKMKVDDTTGTFQRSVVR